MLRTTVTNTIAKMLVVALALGLAAAAPPPTGEWVGEMASGFRVRLTVEPAPGGYRAVLTNPSGERSTLDEARFEGERLRLVMRELGLSYDGAWDEGAKLWRGTLSYQGEHPMTFRRATSEELAPRSMRRPQEEAIARGPLSYRSREVVFTNSAAGVSLAGTLRSPQGDGPFPAVVLISGTGPNTRDEEVDGHKVFLVLADALARRGVSVLSYDKRGVGASGGRFTDATTADFASDAAAAFAFLKTVPAIDSRRIGLLGHSEGGVIAPMVAAEDASAAFVVLMAAPGVRGDRLLVAQAAAVARANGAPALYIERRKAFDEAVYAAVLAAPTLEDARARLEALAARGLADGVLDASEARTFARDTLTPWGRYFIAHDPAVPLKKVRAPVLAVIGSHDLQVPAADNLAAIRAATSGNPDARILELPGLNHLLQTARTGAPSEYGQIEETIAPEALTLMADWVARKAGR